MFCCCPPQADPEALHATLSVLADCGDSGLPLLLRLLRQGTARGVEVGRPLLVRLLSNACNLRGCRQALVGMGAVGELVAQVHGAVVAVAGYSAPAFSAHKVAARVSTEGTTLQPSSPTSPATLSLTGAPSWELSPQFMPAPPPSTLAAASELGGAPCLTPDDVAARMSDLGGLLGLLEVLAAEAGAGGGAGAGSWPGRSARGALGADRGGSANQVVGG